MSATQLPTTLVHLANETVVFVVATFVGAMHGPETPMRKSICGQTSTNLVTTLLFEITILPKLSNCAHQKAVLSGHAEHTQ